MKSIRLFCLAALAPFRAGFHNARAISDHHWHHVKDTGCIYTVG
ncbi:MAG TPA: hypothetical protein VIH78_17765 [Terriglobales bacterium]